jgi:hypothetical protein
MNESSIFGISARAYIVFILISTFCVMSFMAKPLDETFKNLIIMCVSFYFGNKTASNGDSKYNTTEQPKKESTNV